MARHRFARESVETLGQILDPGSIKWDESEEFPVVWNFDFGEPDSIIGRAADLQREDDGWLTAEVVWIDGKKELMESEIDNTVFLTIYANEVQRSIGRRDWISKETLTHITSCRLRSINAVAGTDPWKEDE